ncbi:MAG TPA: Flp family type IVb pilin, partial [Urbifossiella sp.]|nr:Flp family type IVb pilin [Urbifossiella sp.]
MSTSPEPARPRKPACAAGPEKPEPLLSPEPFRTATAGRVFAWCETRRVGRKIPPASVAPAAGVTYELGVPARPPAGSSEPNPDRERSSQMRAITKNVVEFLKKEDGPTAVEYAVMLALIIVVCIAAVTTLGSNANSTFSFVGSA